MAGQDGPVWKCVAIGSHKHLLVSAQTWLQVPSSQNVLLFSCDRRWRKLRYRDGNSPHSLRADSWLEDQKPG